MKLAKKIIVGIAAVAMLVSCLALSVSAEGPKLPSDNIEDVLEYRLYDVYLSETYQKREVGEYSYDSGYIDFVKADAASEVIVDSEDNVLLIESASDAGAGYKMYITDEEDFVSKLITSFDVKVGEDGKENGSVFSVLATLADYTIDSIPLFVIDAANADAASFKYATFNEKTILYETVVAENAAPVLGAWYHVDIIYNLADMTYSLTVTAGGETVIEVTENIGKSNTGVDSLKLYASGADAKTYLDDLVIYEGTSVRNALDSENALADFIIALDAVGKDSDTPIEEKVAIADLYAKLYEGEEFGIRYTAPEGIDKYNEVCVIVENAKAFRNMIYAEAFYHYASDILVDSDTGYARKYTEIYEYRDTYVKEYYDMFAECSDKAAVEALEGMTNVYSDGMSYADIVIESQKLYGAADDAVSDIVNYGDDFIKEIENLQLSNRDYTYMTDKYAKLALLRPNLDVTYSTVADAIVVYDAFAARIAEIEYNVEKVFKPAVEKMTVKQNAEVSKESPYLTANFSEILDNYNIAKTVYKYGSVHTSLNPKTYPGLSALIDKYVEVEEYINGRIEECTIFVSMVEGASASTYYVSALNQINQAAAYLDSNIEQSLEDYEGVAEAIANYDVVLARLATNMEDAKAYIAAATALDINSAYTELRAAVDAVYELKLKGNITGIDGVKEANVAFAAAEAKVVALELASKNLIDAVAELKKADSFEERRALIFRANGIKDSTEDAIDGVLEAKAELEELIAQYNADVAAINALFAGAMENACGAASSMAPTEEVSDALAVIIAGLK